MQSSVNHAYSLLTNPATKTAEPSVFSHFLSRFSSLSLPTTFIFISSYSNIPVYSILLQTNNYYRVQLLLRLLRPAPLAKPRRQFNVRTAGPVVSVLSPLQESLRRFFFVLVSFSLRLLSFSIIFLSSDIYIFTLLKCHFDRSRRPLQIGREIS